MPVIQGWASAFDVSWGRVAAALCECMNIASATLCHQRRWYGTKMEFSDIRGTVVWRERILETPGPGFECCVSHLIAL